MYSLPETLYSEFLAKEDIIQRAHARQAWEVTLPPLNDLSQLDKRGYMMAEMEAKDWAFREGQIQRLQESRLGVPKNLLKQSDKGLYEETNTRLDQIHSQHLKDTERKQHSIQNNFNRELRKLEGKRRNVEEKLELYYTDSKGYAPWAQKDTMANRNAPKELKSYYLDTYEGLRKLEAQSSSPILKPIVKKTQPEVIEDVIKPFATTARKVKNKYMVLMAEVNKQLPDEPLRLYKNQKKPDPRAVSPRVEGPPERDEEVELMAIHLQKLLRGRSIQYKMLVGKEKHLELIQRLRTAHAVQRLELQYACKVSRFQNL